LSKHRLKILYGYPWFPSEAYGSVKKQTEEYISHLNKAGFDVEGFCLTLTPPGPHFSFKELESRWRRGEKQLLHMYEELAERLKGKDVFLNSSGINLHPDFVDKLPVLTVFQCFDDPESSEHLSKPVAAAYDLCLVGNIAEIDAYKSWGVKNVNWSPMGLQSATDYDHSITYESILNGNRDIDLFMMVDKTYKWRRERLDILEESFPSAHFYGKGWKRGMIPAKEQLQYLSRAKIGPNIHNSTGPINFRTFYLPANGVMQICDNKSNLGKIYELNKEVVGFDTIHECIELCRYYLAHDEERRTIAANGWKRALKDYDMIPVFERNMEIIEKLLESHVSREYPENILSVQRKSGKTERIKYFFNRTFSIIPRGVNYIIRNVKKNQT
jgi:spore maturation protein CgeB